MARNARPFTQEVLEMLVMGATLERERRDAVLLTGKREKAGAIIMLSSSSYVPDA
jgi:hypothetical protein